MNKERTVDVRDLILHLLLQWKKVLVCMIVFAVLAGGYSYVKNSKNVKPAQTRDEKLASAAAGCTDDEQMRAEGLYTAYQNLTSAYQLKSEYLQNSILLNLDTDSMGAVEMTFYIEGSVFGTDNIFGVVRGIEETLVTDEMSEEIAAVLGVENNKIYIRELVAFSDSFTSEDMILEPGAVNGAVLTVITYADNAENAERVSEIVEKGLTAAVDNIEDATGKCTANLIQKTPNITYKSYISEKKSKTASEVVSLYNSILKMDSDTLKLSGKVATYYNQLLNAEDDAAVTKKSALSMISKKQVLVGAAGGAFIVLFLACVFYVFSSRIRSVASLRDSAGVPLLGSLYTAPDKKIDALSKAFVRIFYTKAQKDAEADNELLTVSAVTSVAEAQGAKMLYVAVDADDTKSLEIVGRITAPLKEQGINCVTGGMINKNAAAFENAKKADGVIFAEVIGVSREESIAMNEEFCALHGIPVFGVVAIETTV